MAARQNPQQPYYRPFSPTGTDSDDEESVLVGPDGSVFSGEQTPSTIQDALSPDFAKFAYQLAQALSAGPTFSTLSTQLLYNYNQLRRDINYGPFEPPSGEAPESKPGQRADKTSLITLASRDRDRSIFPQPTFCSLMLPRVYQNVKSFQISQISLLSAFYYFRTDKENLLIEIEEKDRLVYDINNQPVKTSPTGSFIKNILDTTIRPGTYSINSLLQELATRLNAPPTYYDFANGISDFNSLFQISGDLSVNFNYPGDFFYNTLTKAYLTAPTRQQIATVYFQSQYAPASVNYTAQQVQVAYYYPVIRDAILDSNTSLTFDWTSTQLPSGTDMITYISYQFTGIDDPVIFDLIQKNRGNLDLYRLYNTFRYRPINKYTVTLDSNTNRITISCPSLNQSLVNLLNSKYNSFLNAQLQYYNLTPQQYTNSATALAQQVGVFQDMYKYLEIQLATYMGISRGTFTKEYYLQLSTNYFLIQNGIDLVKGPGGVLLENPLSTNSISTNILLSLRDSVAAYWPGLTFLDLPIQTVSTNMGPAGNFAFPNSCNFSYSIGLENIDQTRNAIDQNFYVNADYRRRCADVITNVKATEYTLFEVRSKFRQTLQVEVFPRPTQYRTPEYISSIQTIAPTPQLFSSVYEFITPANSTTAAKLLNNTRIQPIPGLSTTARAPNLNYLSSFSYFSSLWITPQVININFCNAFFSFQAPAPYTPFPSSTYVKYPLQLTFQTQAIAQDSNSDLIAFLYHDYGAFLADVTCNRYENPIHYIQSTIVPITSVSTTIQLNVFATQTYYINLRPYQVNPNTIRFTIIPSFPTSNYTTLSTTLSNYNPLQNPQCNLTSFYSARLADPDWIRLPIQSTLWQSDPTKNPLNTFPSVAAPPIGYNSQFVSDDLTDYIPYTPNSLTSNINPITPLRCDPTNNYFMRFLSPYNTDPAIQSYFYSNSQNTILTPNLISNFVYSNGPQLRQYKIAQYYGTHFLSEEHNPGFRSNIPQSPYISQYSISTTNGRLNGYTYQNSEQELALGQGICGFTFLPSDGVWQVDRVTFKTNFLGCNDPNTSIQYLGIFLTSQVYETPLYLIRLSNAIYKLDKQITTVYSNATTLNQGFDSFLGTYMTYIRDDSFARKSTIMTGYTQNGKVLLPDPNAFYSVIAFSDSNTVTYIRNLVGTPVPYPYAYQASSFSTFYDTVNPVRYDMVTPVLKQGISSNDLATFGPPAGYDETTQIYEQSIPQVNSHIHYVNTQNILADSNAFFAWSTIDARTGRPTQLARPTFFCASVKEYALIQDNSISLWSYPYSTEQVRSNDRFFAFRAVIPHDLIFPDSINSPFITRPATYFVGFSGTSNEFQFYGIQLTNSNTKAVVSVKSYDPRTGITNQYPIRSSFTVDTNIRITQVLSTDNRGFFIAAQINTTSTIVYGTPNANRPASYSSKLFPGNGAITMGCDPYGESLYVLTYNPSQQIGASTLLKYTLNDFLIFNEFPDPVIITMSNDPISTDPVPATYSKVMVSRNGFVDSVFLLSEQSGFTDRFYSIVASADGPTGNTQFGFIQKSAYLFQTPTLPLPTPRPPLQMFPGYNGARWVMFSNSPFILGNRNTPPDATYAVQTGWQFFYPTMKIQLTRSQNTYTPVTDLFGLDYPEYPHSMLFGYNNLSTLNQDLYISTPSFTKGKWGQESNYTVSDTQMKGFYFGGYLQAFPLNTFNPSTNNTYYIAMRGYSPTEQYQSLVRFFLPNRYDFGYVTSSDLITEIPLLLGSNFWDPNAPPDPTARPEFFNPTYGNVLKIFNSQFLFSTPRLFGANDRLNYPGLAISSYGYGDFMRQYVSLYAAYQSLQTNLNSVTTIVNSNMNTFINTNLQYLLPSTYLNRQRFTDPILFKIMWSTPLTTNFKSLDDEWGLGWNLGFAKTDTSYATTQIAPSFYKILDEYIYLKLNDTFYMNRLDSGAKENYKITRDPTGTVQGFNSKLLLTNFGNFANVVIQNPVSYSPLLPRMDKLQFNWTDSKGVTLNNNDCEWTMVVAITES